MVACFALIVSLHHHIFTKEFGRPLGILKVSPLLLLHLPNVIGIQSVE